MGEIAEMVLDGTLCEGCGEFMNDEPPGYPCRCASCQPKPRNVAHSTKCSCPTCGKRVKKAGLKDHMRNVHGTEATAGAA